MLSLSPDPPRSRRRSVSAVVGHRPHRPETSGATTGAGGRPSRRAPRNRRRHDAARHRRRDAETPLDPHERSPERDADQRARARRVETGAGTRGQGRRVGLGKRHVRGSVGRLRRASAQVGHPVLLERARVGGKRSGKRLGRARVVRDGTARSERLDGQWIAGPERRGPLSDAEGAADDAEIRAAGDSAVRWAGSRPAVRPRRRRTTRASAASSGRRRCCATPSASRSRSPAPGCTRSGLAYADAHRQRPPHLRTAQLEPAFTNYAKTVLYTTDDVTGLPSLQGENVVAGRARVGALRRRGAHVGLGLGVCGVARDAAAAARSPHHVPGWLRGDRRVR